MKRRLGANEVMADVIAAGEIDMDPAQVISLPTDRHREMLKRDKEESAYTLVDRIPFLNSKIPQHDMQIMVQGDVRLRRPYVVVVARHAEGDQDRRKAARQLAEYLRSPELQWLTEFGTGKYDEYPLFFPVAL